MSKIEEMFKKLEAGESVYLPIGRSGLDLFMKNKVVTDIQFPSGRTLEGASKGELKELHKQLDRFERDKGLMVLYDTDIRTLQAYPDLNRLLQYINQIYTSIDLSFFYPDNLRLGFISRSNVDEIKSLLEGRLTRDEQHESYASKMRGSSNEANLVRDERNDDQ